METEIIPKVCWAQWQSASFMTRYMLFITLTLVHKKRFTLVLFNVTSDLARGKYGVYGTSLCHVTALPTQIFSF